MKELARYPTLSQVVKPGEGGTGNTPTKFQHVLMKIYMLTTPIFVCPTWAPYEVQLETCTCLY